MLANASGRALGVERRGERVDLASTILALCGAIAGGILFNLFPDRIGFYTTLAEPWRFTPLLAPEFSAHLPALNLYWTLASSLCAVNLVLLRWNIYTRCADAALGILGVAILLQMATGGPLTVYAWLDDLTRLGLAVAMVPASFEAISAVGRALAWWRGAA